MPARPLEDFQPDENRQNEGDWLRVNEAAWDELATSGHFLTRPAEDRLFEDPLRCVDGPGWLGDSIRGWRVLCLAAGGGRQGPLYAAAGGIVTVVDISDTMLQLDRQVAAERKLDLQTVQTPMHRLQVFGDGSFDLVIHPVSTCYVPGIDDVYHEIARVLRRGGLYISQHKQPASLQTTVKPDASGYTLGEPYYRQSALPVFDGKSPLREAGTQEFIHRWEQLIGGMCRAGFVIEDLLEPFHAREDAAPGSLGHRSQFVAPYVRIKARRV
ncbi:MAG: class I SAM-dependent methyltransferase [Pirellulaceae bacterium]